MTGEEGAGDGAATGSGPGPREAPPRKYRQAAFVYLHVAILYEAAVYVLWRSGEMPGERGPIWLWLLMGAAIVAVVFWGLWSWRNRWFARAVWALHALRVPWAVEGLVLPAAALSLPRSAYALALVAILLNLAFLARAGWDL